MAHLGFDDTDSRQGLCTTWLATEFVREFEDFDLLGYPRLVRLNPNVPWKTRGNGALYLRFGRGQGKPFLVGEIGGRPVRAFPRGHPAPVDDEIESRVRQVLEGGCAFDDPMTHPGYAILHRRPRASLYWAAVRRIVTVEEALAAASGCGRTGGYKEGRGRIGALAAISWRPRDRTYEVLAYRERSRWGTPRDVDEASVVEMDRRFPSTFHNYDYANRSVVLAPRSPCPVLCGIRGDDPGDLPAALRALRTEPVDRWLLFETNQATDDHVAHGARIVPGTSVDIEGIVAAPPRILAGGHVVVTLRRGAERVDFTTYEPSKELRRAARSLAPDDRVRVVGSVRDAPRTINVEKLAVLTLASAEKPRALAVGWYEPAVSARRHLAKPLRRFSGAVRVRRGRPGRTGAS
jgi:tRNA(Ile2)-agmatinylcytidine synthase